MQVANKQRGEATISLGGKTYVMAATYKAICAIEASTGHGLIALTARVGQANVRTSELAAIIYHAIDAEAYGLSADEIGGLILSDGLADVMAAIVDFLGVALSGGAEPKKTLATAPKK